MITSQIEIPRFLSLKRVVSKIITHQWVGKLIGRFFREKIPSRGLLFHTDDIDPRIKASIFFGMYESAETRFIQKYLRPDLDVIELGASFGIVTCHILKKIMEGKKLICVEANPEMLVRIKRNLEINMQEGKAELVHAAISYNDNSTTPFFIDSDNLVSSLSPTDNTVRSIEVPATRLSYLIDQYKIGNYTLVCDIEGAEAAIFLYDKQAFEKCQQIIIELHDTVVNRNIINVEELSNTLTKKLGFNLQSRRGPVFVFVK